MISLCFMLVAPLYAAGELPPPERTMPGDVKGWTRTWWLAPYVGITIRTVGPSRWTEVQWFDSDGKVVREVAGRNVFAQASFVFQNGEDGSTTVHAVNGNCAVLRVSAEVLERLFPGGECHNG